MLHDACYIISSIGRIVSIRVWRFYILISRYYYKHICVKIRARIEPTVRHVPV